MQASIAVAAVPVGRAGQVLQTRQCRASHREAATENASAHFNQRHHRVLQCHAFRFKFRLRGGRSDTMRLVNQHSHFGKRSRHNEAVPTSQPPAARIFQIHWQHRRAGFLCKKNYPWTQFVSRATRTVRSNHHIATGDEHLCKLKNCASSQARARTANHVVAKALNAVGQQIAVVAGTDQGGTMTAICWPTAFNALATT